MHGQPGPRWSRLICASRRARQVAIDEVLRVLATQRVRFESEVMADAQVIDTERVGPVAVGPGLFTFEEQHIRLGAA